MSLRAALAASLKPYGWDCTYWVAYSGGMDSQVLLSLCCALKETQPIRLRVIHVNHQLHPEASTWAAQCVRICQAYALPCDVVTVDCRTHAGDSIEARARTARYAVFAQYMQPGDVLLTAHHEDDQAETLLLQLCRGAGVKGLAAMPVAKPLGAGVQLRPLLMHSRATLRDYAQCVGLSWIEDDSNHHIAYTRNFMRHHVLTTLQSRWPTIHRTLARSAQHCAEAQDLLLAYAMSDCERLQGSQPHTLSVRALKQENPAKQRLILRTWIQQLGYPLPDSKKLAQVMAQMFSAAPDRHPCVVWQKVACRRYRDDLYLVPSMTTLRPQATSYHWPLSQHLSVPPLGFLQAIPVVGRGLRTDVSVVELRFRQGGETVPLPGRSRHTLKNLMQDWGIPPWERARTPLIFVEEQLIGAVGYYLDDRYQAKAHETGHELTWTATPPTSKG